MSTNGKPNILLIIADDLGADVVLITDRSPERKMYVMTDAGGPMILGELSILSTFLHCGLHFAQAWAQPVCSPTRASIYSGTWPWRNGVGYPSSPQLDPALVATLPELLAPEGYACGLFGKWHLGNAVGFRPPDHGWDRHVGTLGGVVGSAPGSYTNWPKRDSAAGYAAGANSTVYATRDTVEEAGAWIRSLPNDTPWFATIAFHAPHSPFDTPPAGFQLPGGAAPATDADNFNAMAQNLDTNIGRLLGSGVGPAMDYIEQAQLENTVILFLGDNGSDEHIATEEPKTTIYEGGVQVPMIVADGAAVAAAMNGTTAAPRFLVADKLNRTSTRLVHVVDLYETITEIAGVTAALPAVMDSVSLWRFPSMSGSQPPTRPFNFSQYFIGNDRKATIRNRDYKLNCEAQGPSGSITWSWSLYQYWGEEVPGLEDGSAEDVFSTARADVQAGISNSAADNLNELLDELVLSGNYEMDDAGILWEDPR